MSVIIYDLFGILAQNEKCVLPCVEGSRFSDKIWLKMNAQVKNFETWFYSDFCDEILEYESRFPIDWWKTMSLHCWLNKNLAVYRLICQNIKQIRSPEMIQEWLITELIHCVKDAITSRSIIHFNYITHKLELFHQKSDWIGNKSVFQRNSSLVFKQIIDQNRCFVCNSIISNW